MLFEILTGLAGAASGLQGAQAHNKEAKRHNERANRLSKWAGLFNIDRKDLQTMKSKDPLSSALQGALGGVVSGYGALGGMAKLRDFATKELPKLGVDPKEWRLWGTDAGELKNELSSIQGKIEKGADDLSTWLNKGGTSRDSMIKAAEDQISGAGGHVEEGILDNALGTATKVAQMPEVQAVTGAMALANPTTAPAALATGAMMYGPEINNAIGSGLNSAEKGFSALGRMLTPTPDAKLEYTPGVFSGDVPHRSFLGPQFKFKEPSWNDYRVEPPVRTKELQLPNFSGLVLDRG